MVTENKLEQQKNIADHFKVDITAENLKLYENALESSTASLTAEIEDSLKTLYQNNNGKDTTPPTIETKELVKSDREKRLASPVQDWYIGNGEVHTFKDGTELPNQIFVEIMADSFTKFLTPDEAGKLMRRFAEKWAEGKKSLKPLSEAEKEARRAAWERSLESNIGK